MNHCNKLSTLETLLLQQSGCRRGAAQSANKHSSKGLLSLVVCACVKNCRFTSFKKI